MNFGTNDFGAKDFRRGVLVATATLLSVAFFGGEAFGQCRSRGGGPPSGSPTSFTSGSQYAQNPYGQNALVSSYPQNNLIASQYQQQLLASQRQIASSAYRNTQQQRLALMQSEADVQAYRLARAESKRAARAERIAARLREQGRSEDAYTLASVNVDKSPPRR
ncbi:hypothetical protein [Rhodopirellula baltica]|nr:hypothetical protein [Rhodopirellula baltica]